MPDKHPVGHFFKHIVAALGFVFGMVPALAIATPVQLCAGQIVYPAGDGRVLGHLPYAEGFAADMLLAPPGFGLGQPCYIQRAAAVDLTRMLNAVKTVPGLAGTLRGISCYRSIERQRQVFCAKIGPGLPFSSAAQRARYVGPPGFSEHATGYAIDFGIRPSPGCADVEPCIATQQAGRWLLAHAREYGFELSFPEGNAQGVAWEPWHWRWVGTTINTPGAMAARAIFARARANYRANPGLIDVPDGWLPVIRPPRLAPNQPPLFVQPLPPRGQRGRN